jgi:tripartite-type tricarboxylate transporter receptor subunit TctC
LVLAPLEMDRPILAPPGTPPERVAALRDAFHATMNDPAFIAEAEKDHLEIREISGLRVAQILDEAYAMPPDITKAATDAMNVTGGGSD